MTAFIIIIIYLLKSTEQEDAHVINTRTRAGQERHRKLALTFCITSAGCAEWPIVLRALFLSTVNSFFAVGGSSSPFGRQMARVDGWFDTYYHTPVERRRDGVFVRNTPSAVPANSL